MINQIKKLDKTKGNKGLKKLINQVFSNTKITEKKFLIFPL